MLHKHGLAAAACAAFLAIALSGCGRSSIATNPPTGCSASTNSAAIGAVCGAQSAAAVTPAGGSPNNYPGNGTPLDKNETITTNDPYGRVDFWIDTEITLCSAYYGTPNGLFPATTAKLVVWPPFMFAGHQILIDYMHGIVTCKTLKSNGQGIVLGVMGKVYITTNDPLWTVEVDNDGTIKIRVYAGVVNVGKDAQHLQPVTANEEIVIEPNGTIEPPHAFNLKAMSRAEQDAVAFVEH